MQLMNIIVSGWLDSPSYFILHGLLRFVIT